MKLFELINRVQHHVNRDDFVMILDPLLRKEESVWSQGFTACFHAAVKYVFSVTLNSKVPVSALPAAFKRSAGHPSQLNGKKLVHEGETYTIRVAALSDVEAIKDSLKAKLPVIISVRWNNCFYLPYKVIITTGKNTSIGRREAFMSLSKLSMNEVLELEHTKLIKDFNIPSSEYPDNQSHAFVIYGYDKSEDAFICYNGGDHTYFKLAAEMFFIDGHEATGRSCVEAALAISLHKEDHETTEPT